ncbi:MAG: imidazole glycerol phosphate synthase subunit HisH [Clostridiales bacterium]|nr:imidazole glycerol phosphate synthase subunit HisH [Clostridiales bacterium]
MIAIVDYGVGNLFSLLCSFKYIGYDAEVTGDPDRVLSADKIVLPGVGAFGDAADKLHKNGLDKAVCGAASKGIPLLGICLGMQLLFDWGEEFGLHKGLGLIPGRVVSMRPVVPIGLKLPQIGWNGLHFVAAHPLFKYVRGGDQVYFVHSFHAADCEENLLATTEYGGIITAAVGKANVMGCQFHPEKSGKVGLKILKAFAETEDWPC